MLCTSTCWARSSSASASSCFASRPRTFSTACSIGTRDERDAIVARLGPDALVAGVDEAGRGPLAGPVVAAAVILDDQKPAPGLAGREAQDAALIQFGGGDLGAAEGA